MDTTYSNSQFRPMWIWFTHSSPQPRKCIFMKNITCWWIISVITKLVTVVHHKIVPILSITREVGNGFRTSAVSPSLSSGKYRWDLISRDCRCSISSVMDVFKLSSSSASLNQTWPCLKHSHICLHCFTTPILQLRIKSLQIVANFRFKLLNFSKMFAK